MSQIILIFSLIVNLVILWVLLVLWKFKLPQKETKKRESGRSLKITPKIQREIQAEISKGIRAYFEGLESKMKINLNQMEKLAVSSAKNLSDFIKEQQRGVAKEMQFLVANNILKTEKELEEYKKKKIQEIDGRINAIILETSREVLGKSVDLATHEDLVMKALEQAKVDNLFANTKRE